MNYIWPKSDITNDDDTKTNVRVCLNDKVGVLHALKSALLIGGGFLFFYGVGHLIPEGFDWKLYFSQGKIHPIWTPWTGLILHFINWPFVFAITLMAIGFRSYKYRHSPIPIFFAIISLPTLWVLYMGNLDGMVLMGLLLLPWGAPLALMKPQLAAFALLAKRRAFLFGLFWFIISIVIWGFWPVRFLQIFNPAWKAEWTQDIGLFPWGLIIAIPLMWISRGDEDLLMAAGSLATPHLFPYHFIVLMPSVARMRWPWMLITWLVSWTPLSANWLGNIGWHFGNLLSICFWVGIYLNKRDKYPTPLPSLSTPAHSNL